MSGMGTIGDALIYLFERFSDAILYTQMRKITHSLTSLQDFEGTLV